ncbi:glycyl radical protein [candidate division KSB1 bacterium]|nr:glycyl radical protein [candidate division KSB1 bacterium]
MNERIHRLREQSLDAVNCISPERAILVTEFYASDLAQSVSVPVKRALAFKHILLNKQICLNPGELIVGERGPAPKATPTYPEICLHSMQDLEILNSRPKVHFAVDDDTRRIYREQIIPFWQGKTIREKIFREMSPRWKAAYEAGIFTEFQEQRAPGHTVCGNKIYQKGFLDLKAHIQQSLDALDFYHDPAALVKKEELEAMAIAAEALILYAERHATSLAELAAVEHRPARRTELLQLADICRRVPLHAPQTFHEALQYYWFVHLGVISELNPWDSFNPGRLDQHLYPFYRKGLEDGSLTRECAIELLEAFWIKFNNHPSPPKMGVTAAESSTYTDFALINIGGLKPDGSDAVNELSYIVLDVIEEMRLLQPSSMIQVSRRNPDRFIERALKIIRSGFGQPSIFNADAIVEELVRQGKSIEDARNGGCSGCVETGAFGTESYILTGYFNLPKILEVSLHNGIDPRTGNRIGIETGDPREFSSFSELIAAFEKQENYFADIKIRGNNIIEQLYARYLPVPFLSLLIDDCIEEGVDYNSGGARYNSSYIQGVGLGSLTDSLAALKYNIFDHQHISMQQMLEALAANFGGFERLRNRLLHHTPKYGNDDDLADEQARQIFDIFYNSIDGRPTPRGGTFRINLLPTTCHVYFGSMIGALPDGRKARKPLSEGISPVQGMDKNGPTAVLKSAAKIDHLKTGGTLLNQKFTPQLLSTETGLTNLVHLIRGYFGMNGHHIQFNVVQADTLRQAQQHPEQYCDLIVRVAGYSDYFNDLGEDLQNEIIDRTEHLEF